MYSLGFELEVQCRVEMTDTHPFLYSLSVIPGDSKEKDTGQFQPDITLLMES